MIELCNVSHGYLTPHKHTVVLRDISLTINDRARVGILAKPGTGKSTLARILCGIEKPVAGRVYQRGGVSWPIGMAGFIHRDLTVRQNLEIVAELNIGNPDVFFDECINFCDFGNLLNASAKSLTPMQRSVFAYALSLIAPQNHYVFDEKLVVGDTDQQQRCFSLLKIKKRTSGIILISRNERLVREHCDDVFHFEDARLVPETSNSSADMTENVNG